MTALAWAAWRAITSRTGLTVIVVLAIVGALGAGLVAFGHARFAAGRTAGRAEVQKTIDAPATGWSARLDQCQANTATAKGALEDQNASLRRQAAEDAARLAAATKDLASAQRETKATSARIAQLMKPLAGPDQCARAIEVDKRLLEQLK